MKTVGVVLAGCGYLDGAEIYESVLTMLALDRGLVPYQCLAPDIEQMHVVDHLKGEPAKESRRVLIEAARLARGSVKPLEDGWADKLDAVIFPGGFGAAKNYCDWAVKGDACGIHPVVQSFMVKMVEARKPVGVICIAPLVLARALKGKDLHPRLTVGAESAASKSLETFGSRHVACPATDCVVDCEYRIVSTPAYMYDTHIAEVAQGIDKLVHEIVALMNT
ncbi:isoprenoid biosynthesis glyoxalase ElbB [bacterium]|nr:isoprenoid biosynthesis glyoxalase ElbB [bacterium]MBU1983163.1 isoprenoid biosynthesis glyoxalase ElbB [bacterium]